MTGQGKGKALAKLGFAYRSLKEFQRAVTNFLQPFPSEAIDSEARPELGVTVDR